MEAERILVVEDNEDTLELLCLLLERDGFTVLTAKNGRDALEVARREHPDLILLDLSLPEKDGWTMAREAKADPDLDPIPIVAVTAHALPGDRKRALDAGCDDYLSKPLDVQAFREMVLNTLTDSSRRKRAAGPTR